MQSLDTLKAKCKKDSIVNNTNDLFISLKNTNTFEKVYGISYVLHPHGGVPSCCDIAPIMGRGNNILLIHIVEK